MSKAEELATKTVEMASEGHLIHLLSWADIQGILQETAAELHRLAALEKAIMDAEPVGWLVLSSNNDGSTSIEYAAEWKEAAHEHIGDAIAEYGNTEAATWIVRPAYTLNGIKKP